MPVPSPSTCVTETSELKILEAFIDKKNCEILSRLEDLLQHQRSCHQLVEQLVKTLISSPVAEISGGIKDLKLSSEVSDGQIRRRNSYELAKAESNLRRKPFYGEPSGKMPEGGQGGQEKNASNCPWKSWKLEAAFAGIILSNAILLGIQTEWASRNLYTEEPVVFRVLQTVYAMLFVGEIAWRISLSGCKAYLCSADWGWHTLDLFVTFSAVLDVVMTLGGGASLTGSSNSGFRLLRVMKIARLVRAIRVVKVLRFIRALRVLVFSIIHTMRSLVWSLVLLFVIMYSFGILFADAITDYILQNGDHIPQHIADGLVRHFGSLVTSMNTLFRAISGGVTWEAPAEFLHYVGPEWTCVFTFYVAFCCFAVLNVMTGVFCHSAITGAEKDQDLVVQALLHEKVAIKNKLMELFERVDDGTGRIGLAEFEMQFENESVKAVFESLGLGTMDAWTLFQILDSDGNRFIDMDEFVESCIRNRGSAKAVDVCALRHQINKVRRQLSDMAGLQKQMLLQCAAARAATFFC